MRSAIPGMRTIFRWICPASALTSEQLEKGPFFCCEPVSPCYKPAARGIAAGHDAILAGVAELVDALDLGSSDESCGGSSPSARTKRRQRLHDEYWRTYFSKGGFARGMGAAEPPAQAVSRASNRLTMFGLFGRTKAGRRLTPCRSQKPSPRD